MKTITINEKEVEIPTGWENITFEKFNSFSKLINSQITQAVSYTHLRAHETR